MMQFLWDDKYKMGIDVIDQQHQSIFEWANKVINITNNSELTTCFMALYKHVREHFRDEEALMLEYHYPDIQIHILEHNEILDTLVKLSPQINEGTWHKSDIEHCMAKWVMEHIPLQDRKLKNFVSGVEHKMT